MYSLMVDRKVRQTEGFNLLKQDIIVNHIIIVCIFWLHL